ncbi:MAG: hypothetical protein GY932_06560 [Arcobacter sp.]|nr:hypothetical protein [Arcobacter sp.]
MSKGSPSDLHYEIIEQNNGSIDKKNSYETPYSGEYEIKGPIFISPDSTKVLLGSGNMFNSSDLTYISSFPTDIEAVVWTNSEFAYIYTLDDKTVLKVYDNNFKIKDTKYYDGKALSIRKEGNDYIIITSKQTGLSFNKYDTSKPIEEKVIDNSIDDSKCYECLLKDITNKDIYINNNTYIFIDKTNNEVLRYDYSSKEFIDVVKIKDSLELANIELKSSTYSLDVNTLYLGYANESIKKIDFNQTSKKEEKLVTLARSVNGLSIAGNYILAKESSTHYTINKNGQVVDIEDWLVGYSTYYAWDNVNNRVYYYSYDDVRYQIIDQINGSIDTGSPSHNDYDNYGSIFISPDSTKILLGSGVMYNASDLTYNTSFPTNIEAVIWSYIESVVWTNSEFAYIYTLYGETKLEVYDNNFIKQDSKTYAGTALNIRKEGNKYIIITKDEDKIIFNEYTIN